MQFDCVKAMLENDRQVGDQKRDFFESSMMDDGFAVDARSLANYCWGMKRDF